MLARGWEGDPDSLRSGILRGMVRFVALYQASMTRSVWSSGCTLFIP